MTHRERGYRPVTPGPARAGPGVLVGPAPPGTRGHPPEAGRRVGRGSEGNIGVIVERAQRSGRGCRRAQMPPYLWNGVLRHEPHRGSRAMPGPGCSRISALEPTGSSGRHRQAARGGGRKGACRTRRKAPLNLLKRVTSASRRAKEPPLGSLSARPQKTLAPSSKNNKMSRCFAVSC